MSFEQTVSYCFLCYWEHHQGNQTVWLIIICSCLHILLRLVYDNSLTLFCSFWYCILNLLNAESGLRFYLKCGFTVTYASGPALMLPIKIQEDELNSSWQKSPINKLHITGWLAASSLKISSIWISSVFLKL